MPQQICLVDTCFHSAGVPRVPLFGDASIRDCDLVIIDWRQPFNHLFSHEQKAGPAMEPASAKKIRASIRLRKNDIASLAGRGATVVCVLAPCVELVEKNNSRISSLDWMPPNVITPSNIIPFRGNSASVVDGHPFTSFARDFFDKFEFSYAFFQPAGKPFLVSDECCVLGTVQPLGKGNIVFIPGFRKEIEDSMLSPVYTEVEEYFINRFLGGLMSAVDKMNEMTPAWKKGFLLYETGKGNSGDMEIPKTKTSGKSEIVPEYY